MIKKIKVEIDAALLIKITISLQTFAAALNMARPKTQEATKQIKELDSQIKQIQKLYKKQISKEDQETVIKDFGDNKSTSEILTDAILSEKEAYKDLNNKNNAE